jgi:predicted ATPase
MIDQLSLQNFKAFRKLDGLEVKPITVLCGTNSSGKSSILQSMLLLKQTVESQNPNQTLLLNGRFVHLGALENIIYRKEIENPLSFDLTFTVRPDDRTPRTRSTIPLDILLRELMGSDTDFSHYQIRFLISLRSSADKAASRGAVRPIVVEQLICETRGIRQDGTSDIGLSVDVSRKESGTYALRWKNLRVRHERNVGISSGETEAQIDFANLFPLSVTPEEQPKELMTRTPFEVTWVHRFFGELIQHVFSTYTYIGPLREEPSRRYIYENEIVEIGIKGENAAYIYLVEQETTIPEYHVYDDQSDQFVAKKRVKLAVAVKEWLNLMSIREFRAEPVNEIIYLNLNSNTSDRTRVNIADVGFGVSQVFPIVLEGLRLARGGTLLLEQPEIHLHPNMQMQLADYFIALALSGKRVIVETHSDHVINRLVRRIVEDKTLGLSNQIAMYFIRTTANGAVSERVAVDPARGIINWPRDFFDQSAGEQERIIRAGLQKRKEARSRA